MKRVALVAVLLTAAQSAGAHETMIFETTAEEDWCSVINETAMPGDIIRLAPGDYIGPCAISRTPPEEQDEYTIVMSLDPENPARILHDGESAMQLTVEGDQVMLLSLDFGPVPDEVIPVEVLGPREIWIRYNRFSDHGGTAVKVSSAVDGLHILDNDFEAVDRPIDLDLGEGESWVDLGYNRIRGASLGARVRGEWRGWIRENVIWDAVQGMDVEATGELEVRGNWIRFSQQGIDLTTSSAQIEANILHGLGQGIALGQESLQGAYRVIGNSLVTETEPAVLLRGTNSALSTAGNLSLQTLSGGEGDVSCGSPDDCWVDVEAGSYYPTMDPVPSGGVTGPGLGPDFCGRERGEKQWTGGLEAACPGDPDGFEFDFKRNFRCTYADLSGANESCHQEMGDTADPQDTAEPVKDDTGGSCACAAQEQRVNRLWFLLGGVWLLRRVQPRSRLTRST